MTAVSGRIRLVRLVGIAALLAAVLGGCNTIKGVGQDVTALGEGMSQLAGSP